MKLSGWGRFPVYDCQVSTPRSEAEVISQVSEGQLIARGNGRAYGDSALNCRNTLDMRQFNRMLAFDPVTGQLVAEAGVLLADIISTFLPRGWFPSVTPGTKFVTLGGMIAADVHGKNHHRDGSCSNYIDWIDLVCSDGIVRRCSRRNNTEYFEWTIGGMGLTGVILRAAIRLRPVETGWIKQTIVPTPNLDAAMQAFEATQDTTYSVAWIDCLATGRKLGRSLVMLGEHATLDELPDTRQSRPFDTGSKSNLSVPFEVPSGLLNRITVKAFNQFYYWNGRRNAGARLVDWDSYFYPLDAILGWNRIYGRKGFAQFQCALPLERARAGLQELLNAIAKAGAGSFLAVLKRFGTQDSRFSFPMLGYTLALDFPVSPKTLRLMERLDEITLAHGGRFYLAKDSRMTAKTLRLSDQRTQLFEKLREETGMHDHFQSMQSERLGL